MPLKNVKLDTMNESRLRIKLQPSEVPSVNFLREKVSRRLDSESLDPILSMIVSLLLGLLAFRDQIYRHSIGVRSREPHSFS
jgi:hypothetical protein